MGIMHPSHAMDVHSDIFHNDSRVSSPGPGHLSETSFLLRTLILHEISVGNLPTVCILNQAFYLSFG